MIKEFKSVLGEFLIPLARIYFRYFTFSMGKTVLWKYFHWRERTFETRTQFGIKMKVRTNDLVQGYIYYFGIWEPNLTHFIYGRLKENKNRVFVDVGANVGYFSLLAAKYLSEGVVVSIEAFPSIYDRLVENIKLKDFKNIRTVNLAATEKKRTVEMFHAGDSNEGATTLRKDKFHTDPIVVGGLPLAEIISGQEITKTRIIKIDVEGAENFVLGGMYSLLNELPEDVEIVVEINPDALNKNEIEEIFKNFESAGFKSYALFNPYDSRYYLLPKNIEKPVRMQSMPKKQTDVIFSKIDQDILS